MTKKNEQDTELALPVFSQQFMEARLNIAMRHALHGWRPMRWYWRRAAKRWAALLAEGRKFV